MRRFVVTATGIALAGAFIAYGGAATASPNPTASQERQTISKLQSKLDAVIQQYDKDATDLSAASARLSVISASLRQAQHNFQAKRVAVTQMASAAYEQGDYNSTLAMLASNDPQAVLDRADLLSHLSSDARAQLSDFISAARTLTKQQQAQQRTNTAIVQLKKKKAAERQHYQQLIAKHQAELDKLVTPASPAASSGSSGGSGSGVTFTGGSGGGAQAASFALSQVGCPYVWGGTGPCGSGYDCSGLAMAAWASAGVQIPRTTYDQWASLPHVPNSDIQVGDLLYFDGEGHVAIAVAGGNIVDAPEPGMNVEEIPFSTPWYAQNFDGAVRP